MASLRQIWSSDLCLPSMQRTTLPRHRAYGSLGGLLIKHFLNPPNWFTSASIFCGTYAISLLIAADSLTPDVMAKACILVLFGGVFDLLDGRVARMTNRFSEFGVQL